MNELRQFFLGDEISPEVPDSGKKAGAYSFHVPGRISMRVAQCFAAFSWVGLSLGLSIGRGGCPDHAYRAYLCPGVWITRWSVLRASKKMVQYRYPTVLFVSLVGLMTLLATGLAIEAGIWAGAYRFLGALPDYRSAMLYSLNAMTSYGHTDLRLDDTGSSWVRWKRLTDGSYSASARPFCSRLSRKPSPL